MDGTDQHPRKRTGQGQGGQEMIIAEVHVEHLGGVAPEQSAQPPKVTPVLQRIGPGTEGELPGGGLSPFQGVTGQVSPAFGVVMEQDLVAPAGQGAQPSERSRHVLVKVSLGIKLVPSGTVTLTEAESSPAT